MRQAFGVWRSCSPCRTGLHGLEPCAPCSFFPPSLRRCRTRSKVHASSSIIFCLCVCVGQPAWPLACGSCLVDSCIHVPPCIICACDIMGRLRMGVHCTAPAKSEGTTCTLVLLCTCTAGLVQRLLRRICPKVAAVTPSNAGILP
jgi:hypothetical protein